MQKRLPKSVYKSVMATIERGAKLDPVVADAVAAAMKDWALDKGATHYAHVFYPLTGLTAEKHDSFLEPVADGSALAEFAGKTLVQGEPDASSFPNGGLRNTFEARGYTGWDVTSPAYVLENPNGNTLCIPTVFVSMTGEALDHKTPLLRSQQAMGTPRRAHPQAVRPREPRARGVVLRRRSRSTSSIDRHFFLARPDLLNAGRTLFGAKPPKGQEFDDHYFGAIPERVLGFMMDTERELFKLGIPAKTRHNEVAPGQFEIAPMFERANVASDHQQLLMTVFKTVAKQARHGVPVPREAVHRGERLGQARQLLARQLRRWAACSCPATPRTRTRSSSSSAPPSIRAVHQYAGLLRASVASATNDHRLGANEAPPAIISIFLGDQLADVFEQIAKGAATSSKGKGQMVIGVDTLPVLPTDPGDRNRTSPFAFTGNRFEFRAPGSGQTVAVPMVMLNTIMAEALDHCATELETAVAAGTDFDDAVQTLLTRLITAARCGRVQRRRLLREVAARGRRAGSAEPAHDARRPARADHRQGDRAVRHVQGLQRARDAQPLRDRPGAVRADHRCRGEADAGDGLDGHPACGGPAPDRGGAERRCAQGRRGRGGHRPAGRGDRPAHRAAGRR